MKIRYLFLGFFLQEHSRNFGEILKETEKHSSLNLGLIGYSDVGVEQNQYQEPKSVWSSFFPPVF